MENRNDVTTLRDVLFDTINRLNDKDKPMDLARAKVVAEVAQVVINSVKVEVDFAKVTGKRGVGTDFLPQQDRLVQDKDKILQHRLAAAPEPEPEQEEKTLPAPDPKAGGYVHHVGERMK